MIDITRNQFLPGNVKKMSNLITFLGVSVQCDITFLAFPSPLQHFYNKNACESEKHYEFTPWKLVCCVMCIIFVLVFVKFDIIGTFTNVFRQ